MWIASRSPELYQDRYSDMSFNLVWRIVLFVVLTSGSTMLMALPYLS